MGTIRKLIPLMLLAFAVPAPNAAEFDSEALPHSLAQTTQDFLTADTAKARAGMSKFSDDDLQRIVNAFKKGHTKSDQRIFWLVEESYRRNAERVAAERIRFLYLAVLAALGVIALFSALTWRQSKQK